MIFTVLLIKFWYSGVFKDQIHSAKKTKQGKKTNKLWLSCAKLKLSYVEVKAEVVVKVGEEFVVQARVQLLVRRVDGWVGGRIKQN